MRNLTILLIILSVSCAVMAPPGGGPEDRTPPAVIEVFPKADTTNIDINTEIYFEFSERVNKNTVPNSIFISPAPEEEYDLKWKKNKCFLRLNEPLRDSQTYVITLGSGISDLRNNKTTESFGWAFSTGDKIDNCSISGAVFGDEEVSEILIQAFRHQDYDTLNPGLISGGYIIKTDEYGEYILRNLAKGDYRVFAVSDKNRNLKYDIGFDQIGIPQSDCNLMADSSLTENVNFMMSSEDTTDFMVLDIQVRDKHRIDVMFSKKIEKLSLEEAAKIDITDPLNNRLNIHSYFIDKEYENKIRIITGAHEDSLQYKVKISDLQDFFGYSLKVGEDTASFSGSTLPDTTRPSISMSFPRDSVENVELKRNISFVFSEEMDTLSFSRSYLFIEGDKDTLKPVIRWISPSEVVIFPEGGFKSETGYNFSLNVNEIKDWAGNVLKDSVFSIYFKTDTDRNTGSISGVITDNDSTSGEYIIKIDHESDKNKKYELRLKTQGNWIIDKLTPGNYIVSVFKDIDGNGRYSFGRSYPFKPSEKFYYFPRLIEVRQGWEMGNTELIIY